MALHLLVATSGRADASPLAPVMRELTRRKHIVDTVDLSGADVEVAAQRFTRAVRQARGLRGVLLLGDRHETLTAATVATVFRLPIIHIHGGETTYGSYDNQLRDAITKLSHIHFTAADDYSARVIALGERAENVFTVGAPGLDAIVSLPPRRPERTFVVTYHPATLAGPPRALALQQALRGFSRYKVYATRPNSDPGNAEILRALRDWIIEPTPREFLLLCRQAACVIGNSSSGLIEAPKLEVPTVNIGLRQAGRLRGPSVFDADTKPASIAAAVQSALAYDGPFDNPYDAGAPGASVRIVDTLEAFDFTDILLKGAP